jgi:hypothetical protein
MDRQPIQLYNWWKRPITGELRPIRLGKKPRRFDPRTLQLKRYLSPALPPPPIEINYGQHLPVLGMMLNDNLGDCIIAAPGHGIQVWTYTTRGEVTVSDAQIEGLYENWCGYVPGNPSTDQGGVILDIMNNWRQQGFAGEPLDGYAAVHIGGDSSIQIFDRDVQTAIWLFGGINVGLQLPLRAQNQQVWQIPTVQDSSDQPGSWGGHDVWIVGYTPKTLMCITWGTLMMMTWGWFLTYCDEAYAPFSRLWMNKNKVAPVSGFDWATLEADLEIVSTLKRWRRSAVSGGLRWQTKR